MASTFEEKLVQHLHYRVPWQLLAQVEAHVRATQEAQLQPAGPVASAAALSGRGWVGVDLGCGSGLCGRLFRKFVDHGFEADCSVRPGDGGPDADPAAAVPAAPLLPPAAARDATLALAGGTSGVGRMVGADLSPKMVEVAAAGGGYDELMAEDCHETLAREADGGLDIVSSQAAVASLSFVTSCPSFVCCLHDRTRRVFF